ncbi:hypothetical protein [Arthrobacter sp. A2-55]|uniref:hypothetical protein n=1 Tax=Arthrobacter sp. A2-55 TaxID=2897337 RepID=UPI0021CD2397|nr:hypothetical protein [Arthrobacter sp. A2-55]MCU6481934.1 hypothetical protein [Arthrobacter sp. A2-55]
MGYEAKLMAAKAKRRSSAYRIRRLGGVRDQKPTRWVKASTALWGTLLTLLITGAGVWVAYLGVQQNIEANAIARDQYGLSLKASTASSSVAPLAPEMLSDGRMIYGGKIWGSAPELASGYTGPVADTAVGPSPKPTSTRINGVGADTAVGPPAAAGAMHFNTAATGNSQWLSPTRLAFFIASAVAILGTALWLFLRSSSVYVINTPRGKKQILRRAH